jgi:hypothetical protein
MWRYLPVMLGVALAAVTQAQAVRGDVQCYQFDQPYFVQVRGAAERSLLVPDTSAFGRLRAGVGAALRERGDTLDPVLNFHVDSVRLEQTTIVRLAWWPADTLRPGGGGISLMPGPVLRPGRDARLERVPADTPATPHRLVPVFTLPEVTRHDAAGRVPYQRWGYWRPLPSDSMELSWYDGFHGPLFRVAIRGDSLLGTVMHRSDVMRRDSVTGRIVRPPLLPARAVRVACAPPTGPA